MRCKPTLCSCPEAQASPAEHTAQSYSMLTAAEVMAFTVTPRARCGPRCCILPCIAAHSCKGLEQQAAALTPPSPASSARKWKGKKKQRRSH